MGELTGEQIQVFLNHIADANHSISMKVTDALLQLERELLSMFGASLEEQERAIIERTSNRLAEIISGGVKRDS